VKRAAAAALLVLVAALASGDQVQRRGFQFAREPRLHNVPYDGRFTFARIKYQTAPGGYWYQGMPSWSHGYPISEDNLLRIMNEVTLLRGRTDGFNVFALDDPELFKYSMAYIIEVGWWTLTDREAIALRAYLAKGGFVIVDDFKTPSFNGGGGWDLFEANMRRVLPGIRFFGLPWCLRGQRSGQAAADDRQLQHRHLAVLGVVGPRPAPVRRNQRSLQARRQLRDVRNDALSS
jgi:hypothetical protein